MKGYFAYIRVSTVKQGELGSSLQEQRSAIEAYATRHGLSITGWYKEIVTAAKLGRAQYNRMLVELEKGHATGVIIHKIDRSARNLRDWARLGELIDRGIEVRFAHESLDLASRGGRLAADIQAVVAADYIRNLRQEVNKGRYGRLKQGLYPLPAPVGYLNNGKGKVKTIDPEKGPLIRQTFELYGTGRYGFRELRLEMHRRGLRQASGKPLSRTGVATILHNPFYMGVIHIRRTRETFQGAHAPLVSKAVFERAQEVMSGRFRLRNTRHDHAYRRLVTCKACGYALIGERQKGHVYYRCHAKACSTSVREDRLEDTCKQLFRLIAFSSEELRDLAALAKETQASATNQREARMNQVRLAIGRCDDRLSRLTDAFLDSSIDKETFEARKSALILEKRGLSDTLEQPENTGSADALLKKLELGNTAYLGLALPSPREKREIVDLVTSSFVAEGKNLEIKLRFPFDEVAKWRRDLAGAPYRAATRKNALLTRTSDVHIKALWNLLVSRDIPLVPEVPEART